MSGGTFYTRVDCPGGHSTRGDSLHSYTGTSIIRTLSCQKIYLCACVESVAVCLQRVWPLLNEHVCWLEKTNNDAFMVVFFSTSAVSCQAMLKGEKKVSTSVIRTISLIRYHSMGTWDKGVRIIEVALYTVWICLFYLRKYGSYKVGSATMKNYNNIVLHYCWQWKTIIIVADPTL